MPRITSKGQVTIPKELRDKFGLDTGDEIQFTVLDGRIVVRKKSLEHLLEKWVGALKLDADVDTFIDDLRDSV